MAEIKVNDERDAFYVAGIFAASTDNEVVSILTLAEDLFIVSCPALSVKQIEEIVDTYNLDEILSNGIE